MRTVGDVMVTNVVTIVPSATLVDAARAMERGKVGMLPVVEGGEARGFITDRDIVVRAIACNADSVEHAGRAVFDRRRRLRASRLDHRPGDEGDG
jgi:CBS domain-containing protein